MPILFIIINQNLDLVGALLFIVATESLIIPFIFTLKLNLTSVKNKLFELFRDFPSSIRLRKIAGIEFSLGVPAVLGIGIMDIVITELLGRLGDWSEIRVIGSILGSLLVALILNTGIESRKRVYISFSTFLFAFVPLIMLFNLNFWTYFLFFVVKIIYDKSKSFVAGGYVFNLQSQDAEFEQSANSYGYFSNLFSSLGQLLPLGILMLLPSEVLSVNIFLLTIILSSFFPFLFVNLYKPYRFSF